MKLKNSLILQFLFFVFNCSLITLTSSQVTSSISYENTYGFDILWAQSPFSNNKILFRVARLDFTSYNHSCNVPKVMFRLFTPGQEQIITLDLPDEYNAEIDSYNFCGKPKIKEEEEGKKRKRSSIFKRERGFYRLNEEKRKRSFIFKSEKSLYRRTEDHHDHSSTTVPTPTETPKAKEPAGDDDGTKEPEEPAGDEEPGAAPKEPADDGNAKEPKEPAGDDDGAPAGDDGDAKEPAGDDGGAKEPDGGEEPGAAPKEPAGDDGGVPAGDDGSDEPEEERRPLPVSDKIKVLAFNNEFVLIYYKCGNVGEVCGSIYSINNIQVKLVSIKLEGNCDDMNAVRGANGFLYLCYNEADLSIRYQNWFMEGNEFTIIGSGIISNVTIPNKSEAEGFSGGLLKPFSTGPRTYSLIMGTYYHKPSLEENFYTVPIKLYAYFLTNENSIIDPYLIYENIGQTNSDLIQLAIQICHPLEDGNGYKCLISLKNDKTSTTTKFVSIQFLPSGEVISQFEFDVSPATEVTTTLDLKKGGYCIGVVNEIDDKEIVDGLIYNDDGTYSAGWGMPSNIDYYDGKVGITPNNLVWGTENISANQTGYWRVFLSQL